MAKSKKILITGGLGLIGHNVIQRLERQGHDICCVDTCTNYGVIPQEEIAYLMAERRAKIRTTNLEIDVANARAVNQIMDEFAPDIVIHLASFPRQKVVNADPAAGSQVMSQGLLNLLESGRKGQIQRFVYVSSSMVYGHFQDNVKEDAQCRPQGQYGIMKLAGEWLVRDYTRRGSFEHVILRPSAVYGPLDVEDRVISRFMLTAMRGGVLQVNGAGETLDFTYVDDAADGIVAAALAEAAANNTYNITKSHSWSLLDAANLAVRIVGRGSVEVRDRDPDFPSRGALDISAARRDLGFNPLIDVEAGFQLYHQWLRSSLYWQQRI